MRERAERQGPMPRQTGTKPPRPDRPTPGTRPPRPPRPPRPDRPTPGPRDENKWRDWARNRNLEEKRKLDYDPQSIEKKSKRPDGFDKLYGGDDYDRRRKDKKRPDRGGFKGKSKGGAKRVKFPKAKHPNMMKQYSENEKAKKG